MNYSEQGKLAILNKSKNNSASLRGSVIIFINALFIVGSISYFNRRALISHHYPKRDIAIWGAYFEQRHALYLCAIGLVSNAIICIAG